MFQLPSSIFILINKAKSLSKHSRRYNFLIFFVDWSITDAKLFFEASTQLGNDDWWYSQTSVCVHVIAERNF